MKSAPTSLHRLASIDIGTNTILLLIAEVQGGELTPLYESETVVRLGERLQKNGVLSEEAMQRGLQALKGYLNKCQEQGVQQIFAVGTSALREAKNANVFLQRAYEQLDLHIEVISGEEEAQLSFLAVAMDLKEIEKSILVVDVGGGSTEFILGKGIQINQWESLPIGSVRSTEEFLHSDPVQEEEWVNLNQNIRKWLEKVSRPLESFRMISVGGTATTLASVEMGVKEFVPEKIHHFELKREALRRQLSLYRSKTIQERREIPGLAPSRADVILAGGAILYKAMEEMGSPSTEISCHGIRYGLLYQKLNLWQQVVLK